MGTIGNFQDKLKVIKELLRVSDKVYLDFYSATEKDLLKIKEMYKQEGWLNVRIDGKTLRSDDGLESLSMPKSDLTKIIRFINARVKYYDFCDFAVMAEIFSK